MNILVTGTPGVGKSAFCVSPSLRLNNNLGLPAIPLSIPPPSDIIPSFRLLLGRWGASVGVGGCVGGLAQILRWTGVDLPQPLTLLRANHVSTNFFFLFAGFARRG